MSTDEPERVEARLLINGRDIATPTFSEFLEADERRATSFVSPFGSWTLPPEVAEAMAVRTGRLEWFHDTGELVLIGADPEAGVSDFEVQTPETPGRSVTGMLGAVADTVAGPLGAPGMVYPSGDGAVRETVLGSLVPEQTRVAVLAVIEHGPLVHKKLWGWHAEHRRREGWSWLMRRLDARDSRESTQER